MYISTKDWKNYIDKLRMLNDEAADAIVKYVQKNGFGNTDALIRYANAVVQKYGSGSAALAAAMYDATAEASGKFYDPAEPAPLPEYGEVAKTVHGTLKRSRNVNELAGAVSRLVKRSGADTTLQNAYRDRPTKKYGKKKNTGAQIAWVPVGDTCPFCLMLASNGWRNQTVGGAQNHAEHIHSNCDCTYAVRFDSNSGVVGYDPDVYKEMFDGLEGDTWEEKVNAMRRQQYEKNKDKINAQKRMAYAERIGLGQHKYGKKVFITDQAIEKIKAIPIPGFTDENINVLQKTHKELLSFAKEHNNSDEVSCLMSLDDNIHLDFIKGTQHEVDVLADSDSYHWLKSSEKRNRSLVLCHNHPGLTDFSQRDIFMFVSEEKIKAITIVTNQGQIKYLSKGNSFDKEAVIKYFINAQKNKEKIDETVENFLKTCYSYGVERR